MALMRTSASTRFPVAVGVAVHVGLPVIFVINIIEMSGSHPAKKAVLEIIEILRKTDDINLELGTALNIAIKVDDRNKTGNPIDDYYIMLLKTFESLIRNLLNGTHFRQKEQKEFENNIDKCNTDYMAAMYSTNDKDTRKHIKRVMKLVNALYLKFAGDSNTNNNGASAASGASAAPVSRETTLKIVKRKHFIPQRRYPMNINRSRVNIMEALEEGNHNNNNNHKGGRRTMRAKRRRQI